LDLSGRRTLLDAHLVLSKTCSAYGFARPGSVPFPVTMTALLYAWLWTPIVGLVVI